MTTAAAQVPDYRLPGPDYDAHKALAECYDLWASGAWFDHSAVANLAEVMEHVKSLLGTP